jgi:hypothetical protein
MGPWTSGAIGSTVDQRWRGHVAWRHFTGMRCTSARGRRCSSALVGDDKEGEAEPERCSPEHERRRRGGAMAVEDGGG